MFGVTLWEMFTYGQEPWIGLNGSQVRGWGGFLTGWVVGTGSFLVDFHLSYTYPMLMWRL